MRVERGAEAGAIRSIQAAELEDMAMLSSDAWLVSSACLLAALLEKAL